MSKYDPYKKQVLETCLQLMEAGFFGTRHGSAGNVSVQVDGEDTIVITPSGIKYTDLSPADLCVLNFNGARLEGPHEPSVEAPMHLACYQHRPDVSSVIHTHQPHASAFGLINHSIPALFDEVAVAIGHVVEVVPYGLSGSNDLLENVVAKLDNRCHCYILQNHGALCMGPSLEKTLLFAELLEKTAMVYQMALATGKEITTLPEGLPLGLFQITTMRQDMEIARKAALMPAAAV
ncbi:MAG: class II aldolase/adducin family protein [Candidatus Hydrogenedens sp.]|nr:class II aldolase/adducin family protein [Candidatus Hydrogenedens sp.]